MNLFNFHEELDGARTSDRLRAIHEAQSRKDMFDGAAVRFSWAVLPPCNFILVKRTWIFRKIWVTYYPLPKFIDIINKWSIVWPTPQFQKYLIRAFITMENHCLPPDEPITILNRFHAFVCIEWHPLPRTAPPTIGLKVDGVLYNLDKQADLRTQSQPVFRKHPLNITNDTIHMILTDPADLRFFEHVGHTISNIQCVHFPQKHVVRLGTKDFKLHKLIFYDHPFVYIVLREECDDYPCHVRLSLVR